MTLDLRLVLDDDQLGKIAERVAEILGSVGPARTEIGYVDVAGAGRYLGVSEERVRKLIAQRSIPFFQEGPGCRITFSLRDLNAWMETHRHAPRGGDA